jgi:hypothetical protein
MKKIIFLGMFASIFLSCGKLIKSIQQKDTVNSTTVGIEKPVKDFVDEAIAKDYKVEALDGGIYMMDYPLDYEGETRFQRVYFRDWYDERSKKQTYFINSYICDYNDGLDLKGIICLKKVPDDNGGEKEALYIQTAVPTTFINGSYDEFMNVVFEVAANADYIAKKFNNEKDLE